MAQINVNTSKFVMFLLGIKYTKVVPPIKLVISCKMVTFNTMSPIVPIPSAPKELEFITTTMSRINILNILEKNVEMMLLNIVKNNSKSVWQKYKKRVL
jgi:hypothetical protein